MKVSGKPCPITEPVTATVIVSVGTGVPDKLIYLPLIMKSNSSNRTDSDVAAASQVTGLQGINQIDHGLTQLAWQPNDATEQITGYRIYRSPASESDFTLLATVPGDMTDFTDHTAGCGYTYYITAVNDRGESPASAASYFSLPCR
jgi:fibronectin type 3 domain-containing protein